MDNAIASKDALNLTVGVSLTSEQVAALTHDIVWMEDQVVDGQHVLVPVVYLAQADNRLAPDGALIQGSDVTLIAGKNLDNAGTIKGTNSLSAMAGNDLVNSGLLQASGRLDLLAGNDLTNKAGGIIAGSTVSLTTVSGDVVNERTLSSLDSNTRAGVLHQDYADSAARIEAANDLTIQAGRDVNNIGSVLQSGRDTTITAGRDVNLVSAQTENSHTIGTNYVDDHITQLSGSVNAGGDLSVQAGRDITAVDNQIWAKNDVSMSATENLTLSSAADEDHTYSKGKHTTRQTDHVAQISTTVTAGGNVVLSSGQDMTLVSSNVTAGKEAYLVAGGQLGLLAAQNSDYSLYDMKKKGSFGSKKTRKDETTQVTNIGSQVTSGGDLALVNGGDQLYQAAKLNSGNDLLINSGGAITFEGVKDLHQEDHEKSNSSMAWVSMSDKGSTDETLQQTEMTAKGQTVINAVNGLNIDIKQINQNTVSQTIDAMVKADPNLAWLKEADQRGDVDWRQVKELHDSFKYSNSGLGEGAMLAIIIIVTICTAGAASGLAASAGGAMGAGTTMAAGAAATAESAAVSAGLGNIIATGALTSLASTGAVSLINDKGNLGAALGDTFSSGSLKNAAIGGLSAGALSYADSNWFQSADGTTNGGSNVPTAGPIQNPGYSKEMLDLSNFEETLLRSGTHALINSGISTAINGGSFGSNLTGAAIGEGIDLASAAGNKAIGSLAHGMDVTTATAEKLVLHAVLGGLISKAKGGDFASGAIAGGVAEGLTPIANAMLADYVSSHFDATDLSVEGSQDKIATAQIIGLIAAGMAGGNPATGSLIGGSAEKYNTQYDPEDPTNILDENGITFLNQPTALDKLKAQLSLLILTGLIPGLGGLEALLGESSDGLLAGNTMLNEVGDGLGTTASGAGGLSGGAIDSEVGAGETASAGSGGGATDAEGAGSASDNAATGADDWAKMSGQLSEAAKGKGNFGIGSGTREEAEIMGEAWVGEGYKVASDGKTLVSQDGLRQYRPPTYKPNQQGTQANFEQRFPGQESKRWQSNGHLDITD